MGFIVFKDLEDMRFDGFSLEEFQKKRHLGKIFFYCFIVIYTFEFNSKCLKISFGKMWTY